MQRKIRERKKMDKDHEGNREEVDLDLRKLRVTT